MLIYGVKEIGLGEHGADDTWEKSCVNRLFLLTGIIQRIKPTSRRNHWSADMPLTFLPSPSPSPSRQYAAAFVAAWQAAAIGRASWGCV